MFIFLLLALFLAIAVMSLLGLTADSRDLHPRLPVHAPGNERESAMELWATTALPPHRDRRS